MYLLFIYILKVRGTKLDILIEASYIKNTCINNIGVGVENLIFWDSYTGNSTNSLYKFVIFDSRFNVLGSY